MSLDRWRQRVWLMLLVAAAAVIAGSAVADEAVCQYEYRRRLLPGRDKPRCHHYQGRHHADRGAAADHGHDHD